MTTSRKTLLPVLAGGLMLASVAGVSAQDASPAASMATGELTPVSLQLQWAPQAQFAGYFAAAAKGYWAARGLDVTIVDGGPDVVPQVIGSDPAGPTFTISWVPKVLEVRESADLKSDLVNIAQIFQRSGTKSVSWAPGKGPDPVSDASILTPADFAGKKVGAWGFGNEYEVTAAATAAGLVEGTDYEKVNQDFNMLLLLNREIDVAEAMIYNEYAQVLEATDPKTGALYQPEDLNVIDYNEVGTSMLQDAIFARAAWLAEPGSEDVATQFLAGAFEGWIYCRDNPDDCIRYTVDAGSTLGAGHQAWMMNEINPLIWPSPAGIGALDPAAWAQTVGIATQAGIIKAAPDAAASRTDLADAARALVMGDTMGTDFVKGTVTVTPAGE
ncbi:MAG: ABC transporter substrate-binding protein [Chloroflexi bacterium]|nr:ABC transporter substrate-binding protein [Chloroflexota bacterium]